MATDADNVWTDASAVDAHAHIGWTYDYYFKRHGRHGLDDRDRRIVTLINGVTPEGAVTLPISGQFSINAFWCDACGPGGVGTDVLRQRHPAELLPGVHRPERRAARGRARRRGARADARRDRSSRRISSIRGNPARSERGVLRHHGHAQSSSSFSRRAPDGRQADYLLGEDVFRAFRPVRSTAFGRTRILSAYSRPGSLLDSLYRAPKTTAACTSTPASRITRSTSPSKAARTASLEAFGGRLWARTTFREQIEKVFYRAFTEMLPSERNLSRLRGSPPFRPRAISTAPGARPNAPGVTQAWTAVGVN